VQLAEQQLALNRALHIKLDMADRRIIPQLMAEATKERATSFQRHSASFQNKGITTMDGNFPGIFAALAHPLFGGPRTQSQGPRWKQSNLTPQLKTFHEQIRLDGSWV
jgi:hypothetical protein